jgi:hypothetical protein
MFKGAVKIFKRKQSKRRCKIEDRRWPAGGWSAFGGKSQKQKEKMKMEDGRWKG